jgi:hypothetical protein
MKRSAKVDLPWSMCAMMEKLRICCMKNSESQRYSGEHAQKTLARRNLFSPRKPYGLGRSASKVE